MGLLDFIANNFMHVLPILFAGVVALALFSERVKTLFFALPLKDTQQFEGKLRTLVLQGHLQEALALCDAHPSKPVAQIYKTAILRAHLPEESVEQGLELVLHQTQDQVQKRTHFLGMIANVSTLLGLFGTIIGLIASFQAVAAADPQQKAALLTQGISTAMNATMMGLGVAIPCLVAFSFLMNKALKLKGDFDASAMRAMDAVRMRLYALDDASIAKNEGSSKKVEDLRLGRIA